jgi:hypothetical protein
MLISILNILKNDYRTVEKAEFRISRRIYEKSPRYLFRS